MVKNVIFIDWVRNVLCWIRNVLVRNFQVQVAGYEIPHLAYYNMYVIYLFGVLRRFQHCTGHMYGNVVMSVAFICQLS